MSSGGLRAGSGVTVGMLGILTGIRSSLALSAAGLCLCTALTAALTYRNRDGAGESGAAASAPPTEHREVSAPTHGTSR